MNIGQSVIVKYKNCTWNGTIIRYDFPYYTVELSNGLELSYYSDEIEES